MATWGELERSQPEFAARVRGLFEAGRHKTIATLRADGSPRISGIECEFVDGELRFGSMPSARKGADLRRDPRFALHGPTFHPVEGAEAEWPGEAKIAGRAVPMAPSGAAPGERAGEAAGSGGKGGEEDGSGGDMFVADIGEVVVTGLDEHATKLVIESWTPTRGYRRVERT